MRRPGPKQRPRSWLRPWAGVAAASLVGSVIGALAMSMTLGRVPGPSGAIQVAGTIAPVEPVASFRPGRYVDQLDVIVEHRVVRWEDLVEGSGMNSDRVLPCKHGDTVVGLWLVNATPDSFSGKLGLEEGDLVVAINGHPIDSPDAMLRAYERWRRRGPTVIETIRRGQRMVLRTRII